LFSVTGVSAFCRVAFQTLEFTDMTSGSNSVEPTGPSQLASRCFAAAGYKVIHVSWLLVLSSLRYTVQFPRKSI